MTADNDTRSTTPTPTPPADASPAAWHTRPGCLPVGVGLVLVAAGIPMLVCPGPGIGAIVLGISLIGAGLGLRRSRVR